MGRFFRLVHTGWAALPALLLPAGAAAQDPPPESIFKEPLKIEASTVTATVPPVTVVEDTVVYNAAAFHVAEDAALEDLLKRIPGLEVDGRRVTLNGRPVEKLLINGQLYFGGDVAAGLKNIQADMVEQVRAYEMLSDFARLSGVDDGEEVPVLDLKIKKRMMDGWQGSVTGAGGTAARYRGRANAGKITKEVQTSLFAHLHNMPVGLSLTNATLSQLGTGGSGDPHFQSAGASFAKKRKDLTVNTNIQYSGNTRRVERETRSQSIQSSGTTFYEGEARTLSDSRKLNAELTLEWRPRPNLTLYLKPVVTLNGTDSWSNPYTLTFDTDPDQAADRDAARVNASRQNTASYTGKTEASVVFQVTRRAAKRGRSYSFRTQAGYGGGHTASFNDYRADYYRKKRDPAIRKQFLETPWDRFDGSLQFSVNEPLAKNLHFQGIVNGRVIRTWSDRLLYSLESLAGEGWTVPETLSERTARAALPGAYADALNPSLTSYGLYTCYLLTTTFNLRIYRKKWNATLGTGIKPQWGFLDYRTAEEGSGRERTFVCYAAPNLSFRYNRSKTDHLTFSYRSWTTAPTAYNLIPVRSGTNPLYVHIGNPDLKPSFTHRLTLGWRSSNLRKQRGFVAELTGNIIQNAFSSSTEYDPDTGGRTVISKNIGGNWNVGGSTVWNKSFGKTPFSLVNHASFHYGNDVSFLYSSKLKQDEVNTMKRLMVKERLDLSYREGIAEVIARVGGEFTDERSVLRPDLHQHPLTLITGAETTLRLPWKLRFGTDLTVFIQRGYAYEELNRNLFIWNAFLSRAVLRGKGTIRLSGNDILGQQVNMTRRFGAYSRAINTYNGVNRYFLLQFFYRFHR